VIDTGKKSGSSKEYVLQNVGERLNWDTPYSFKVKVWDNNDLESEWSDAATFSTIPHPYPYPDFSWSPISPAVDEIVQFADESIFYDGTGTWNWDFGDGDSTTTQNPTHSYSDPAPSPPGYYEVKLTVTDGDGYGPCALTQNFIVTLPLPEWREIAPY
jgi:PKD repeat protein